MANICQIGAGMIGQAMAIDLARDHNVSLGDININSIKDKIKNHPSIEVSKIDVLNQKETLTFIKKADIVLLAVPPGLELCEAYITLVPTDIAPVTALVIL